MKYGVLGTGDVACTIADKLIELGHEVMIGSRTADNPRAVEWARKSGEQAFHGTLIPVPWNGQGKVANKPFTEHLPMQRHSGNESSTA